MNTPEYRRTKWLHIRLKPDEYAKLNKQCAKTTFAKLSEYCRSVLFNKPIVSTYRDQSLDDFMAEMIKLRTELNSIGININQAVKKLHTLSQISEFKAWIIAYDTHEKISGIESTT